jgi:hypothetical protein
MSLHTLFEKMGWSATKKKKRKGTLVRLQDGKRHRVDENGNIIGVYAKRRHDRELRRIAKGAPQVNTERDPAS